MKQVELKKYGFEYRGMPKVRAVSVAFLVHQDSLARTKINDFFPTEVESSKLRPRRNKNQSEVFEEQQFENRDESILRTFLAVF